MPTNREILNNQDIAKILTTLEDGIKRNYRCVINILNESSNSKYNIERKCVKNCAGCINDWLDEEAIVLPTRGDKK